MALSPLLEVEDLRTYFRAREGVVKAVDGVSFAIAEGASVGVLGESGSGKSVASMSLLRLVDPPGYIAGGRALFRGRDLLAMSEREIRAVRGAGICVVFQEPMTALNPVYTVGRQIVETIRAHRRVGRREARERAVELLELVGIPAPARRARDYPHEMSGGMRQRVMIAMALANEPDLLILDEPTTALDVTIQAQILDLVRDLRARVRTAVLLISHDIDVVAEMCDEVIVMYAGRVMERARTERLIASPRHPYSRGLLASSPARAPKGQRLTTIPGNVPSPHAMPRGCPFAPRCPERMARCDSEIPPLRALPDGTRTACWLYA